MIKCKVVFTKITDDFKSQALVTLVKKQKKSEKFMNFSSMRHMTIKTLSSIRLADLTIEDQQYLLKEVKKQLLADAQLCDYKLLNIKYKKETYKIEYTVRYLHPAVRFAVKNFKSVEENIVNNLSIVFTKPGTNINLTKCMVEIVTNSS